MSIVALKRNSRRYQAPISGRGHDGFSLVGGHRNIGSVGPTNLAKSVTRTRFRGTTPMGHGGCCGTYKISICNSGSCCSNDPSIIKPTVKNNKGSILKQYKWIHSAYPRYWVKPDDSMPKNYSQGVYVQKISAQFCNCVVNKEYSGVKKCNSKQYEIIETNQFYPPTALNTSSGIPSSPGNTKTGLPYGNGLYYWNASGSAGASFRGGRIFDLNNSTFARTNNNRYNTTTGIPTSFSGSTTISSSSTPVRGEFWEIQLPTPIVLYKFTMRSTGSSSGRPKKIMIVAKNNGISNPSSQPFDVLYESTLIWNINTTLTVNLTLGGNSKTYNTFRYIVTELNAGNSGFTELAEWTLYEGYINSSLVNCKAASYHIGGKKYYQTLYSKDLNRRPTSCSQYISSGLWKKNNLPTPPCLQPFPMNLSHNGCDKNYLTPQEAIADGVLPSDWMNCNPSTNPNCVTNQGEEINIMTEPNTFDFVPETEELEEDV